MWVSRGASVFLGRKRWVSDCLHMECYLYELPTTGAISFAEICVDESNKFATHLAAATSARAGLRTALKESKRTDGEDFLKLVKVVILLLGSSPH